MVKDQIPLRGRLVISLNNKVVREIDNMVVDGGASWVANRMMDAAGKQPDSDINEMQIGGDATTEALTQTSIDPALLDVAANSSTDITTTSLTSGDIGVAYSTTFDAGVGDGPVVEAGLFAGAFMVARTTFLPVNKGPADELAITWTIKVSNGSGA